MNYYQMNYCQMKSKKNHMSLNELLFFTKRNVFGKDYIKNQFGINCINNILYVENMIVCFQYKNSNSPLASTHEVESFITAVDNLSRHFNIYAVGVYLTKSPLNFYNKILLDRANVQQIEGVANTFFYSIYDNNEFNLLNKVYQFLYTHGIYMYDDEGDCIMEEPYT